RVGHLPDSPGTQRRVRQHSRRPGRRTNYSHDPSLAPGNGRESACLGADSGRARPDIRRRAAFRARHLAMTSRRRKSYQPAPGRRGTVAIQDDPAGVAEAVADRFRDLAHAAVSAFDAFRVALSGGSTPKDVYERLALEPYRSAIEWNKVDIFFGDERVVPPM